MRAWVLINVSNLNKVDARMTTMEHRKDARRASSWFLWMKRMKYTARVIFDWQRIKKDEKFWCENSQCECVFGWLHSSVGYGLVELLFHIKIHYTIQLYIHIYIYYNGLNYERILPHTSYCKLPHAIQIGNILVSPGNACSTSRHFSVIT